MRACARFFFSLILVALLTEVLLAIFDPLGLVMYANNERFMMALVHDADRGYVLPSGQHHFYGWSATIDANHNRIVPDAQDGLCVVALGDSVTFGSAVNDAETWPNQFAVLSGAQVHNTAYPGYNTANVLGALRAFPHADLYIYLMIYNDDAAAISIDDVVPRGAVPWLWRYATYILPQGRAHAQQLPSEPDRFHRDIAKIMHDPRVMVVGFAGDALAQSVAGVTLIPQYTSYVSAVDGHPNGEGHRHIARAIWEVVQSR